jgi:hypothetical protein
MSRKPPDPTPAVEQAIVAYVRAGGFPHVAAEAAGVPRAAFAYWLRQAERPRAGARLRAFAEAVRQAHAQARLGAEVAALGDKPLDWLRSGPGRETPDSAGWTGTVRPRPPGPPADAPSLARPEVQGLISTVLRLLEPHPEIRAAVAASLPQAGLGPTDPA